MTSRKAMTFSAPDDGATEATGEPAQWDMTDPETISHISVWSGFDGDVDAKYLFPAALKAPRIVVEGDVLILTANDIEFPNLAAA
uniref:phage tail fiber protein n=1 Tax=Nitrospira cf. moscoviensis SBR1015 TaxID=96242 RepID=UPI0011241983|nr:hypothetical protein [Nitrospira cf. moscoviensis SBR1015]